MAAGGQSPSRVLPWLLLGTYLDAQSAEKRAGACVSAVLNVEAGGKCPDDWDLAVAAKARYLQCDMVDVVGEPTDLRRMLPGLLDFIERMRVELGGEVPTLDLLKREQAVPEHTKPPSLFVHCEWGVNRSPTVILGYLMWQTRCSLDTALRFLKSRRPMVYPRAEYVSQLRILGTELWQCEVNSADEQISQLSSGPFATATPEADISFVPRAVAEFGRAFHRRGNANFKNTVELPVLGRISKSRCEFPEERVHLTHDPSDAVAFFLGQEGMRALLQTTTTMQILELIGFTREYVELKRAQNMTYELLVVPAPNAAASAGAPLSAEFRPVLATWDGVLNVLTQHYPVAAPHYALHLEALKTTPLETIQSQTAHNWLQIHAVGPSHELFLNYERFVELVSSLPDGHFATLAQVRLFLFNALGLRGLFRGDGYTYSEEGKRGCREYFVPNITRAEIPGLMVIPLPDP